MDRFITPDKDYQCKRYIDDIFLFVQDKSTAEIFCDIARIELEKFKLHFNNAKTQIFERPFVTSISSNKVKIKIFMDSFFRAIKAKEPWNYQDHIFDFREIVKACGSQWNALTNFTMSSIIRNINALRYIDNEKDFTRYTSSVIKLFFTSLAFDTRIGGCYKTYQFIMATVSVALSRTERSKSFVLLLLHNEVLFAVRNSINNRCLTESLSLLNSIDCINYKAPSFIKART